MSYGAIPCDDCAAGCCREYHILLTGDEATRIAATLVVPMADFCELRARDRAEGEFRIRLRSEGGEVRHHRLQLRRVKDDHPDHDQRCIFLLTVGTRGRCGIYALRPRVCATYPTTLEGDGLGRGALVPYCPPRSWTAEMFDVPLHRLWHRQRADEMETFRAFVDAWNHRFDAGPEAAAGEGRFYQMLARAYRERTERSAHDSGDRAGPMSSSPEELRRSWAAALDRLA